MKKVIIAMTVLAAFGLATVLDGVGGLGLGENPAYPALWKNEKRLDVVAPLSSKTESSDDGTWSIYKETTADGGFSLGSVAWTDKFGDVWYGISYGPLLNAEGKTTTKEYSNLAHTVLDATETKLSTPTGYALNLAAAKDFALLGGFTGGVNLGINQDGSVWKKTYKTTDGVWKVVDNGSESSDLYLTLGLGAAKNIAANQKVLIGQTLASKTQSQGGATTRKENGKTDKDYNKANKEGSASNGLIPAQTAVGYVYTVSDSLEFGAQLAHDWQSAYKHDSKAYGQAVESEEVTIKANDTLSLAVDYIFDQFQVQGYLNMAKGTGIETTDSPDTTDQDELKGVDNTTLGVNLLWTPAFANVGTIGVGIENSKEVDYDFGAGPKTDTNTSATLFYTYLF
ncbi:hypothetical protein NO1_0453 [Candidatus Termititenax aidoneus]|uniref:Uncharacterized protein n=1 Tax=Termititenax aidoneus TaxID=2218524 RepID=A0A388T8Q2_TERA1|nr:hypothetical protein NO1_0453 [Candidatus Termititenax aidoneus]